jgi:tetratricopeptide (TPR) repeat protein
MTEDHNPILEAYLTQFLTTNLIGKQKLLVEHGDVLLTEEAEQLLTEYANQARHMGKTNLQAYETHLRFLSECRKYGIDSVFGAMQRAHSIVQDSNIQKTAQKAATLMGEGPAGKNVGELQDAIPIIQQMLPVVRQIGRTQAILEVRHSLGTYLAALGNFSGDLRHYSQAVQEFNSGLELISASAAPLDRAKFQVSVGQAYWQLGRLAGDPDYLKISVANLREGKASMERLGAQDDLITSMGSLANALTTLGEVSGSQRILEEAISLHQLAGDSVSRSSRPLEWALHKANLANTYRTYGNQFNLSHAFELGLAACEASLEERRISRAPERWADSESIRGAILMNRGSLTGSRSDLEAAVEALASAAEVHTRERNPRVWSDMHHNRGNALGDLGELTREISYFEAAIDAHQTALLERRRDNRPADWAMTVNSLAIELRRLGTLTGRPDCLDKSAELYASALSIRTLDGDPLGYLETSRNLARLQMARGLWPDASRILAEAIEAAKVVSFGISDRTHQRKLLAVLKGVADELGYAYLKQGRVEEAILSVLNARAILSQNSDFIRKLKSAPEFEGAWLAWQTAVRKSDVASSRNAFAKLHDAYLRAHTILQSNPESGPCEIDFARLNNAIPNDGGIAVITICEEGGAIITISRSTSIPDVLWLDDANWEWMMELMHQRGLNKSIGWLDAYNAFNSAITKSGGLDQETLDKWNDSVISVLGRLGERLMMPLCRRLQTLGLRQGAEIIVAATGILGLVPLHAAPVDDNRQFLDEFAVSYAPTITSLVSSADEDDVYGKSKESLLAVTDPRGDLNIYANPACAAFAPDSVCELYGSKATVERVLSLMQNHEYLSFYCHGKWDRFDPDESGLAMADGQLLTVAMLMSLDLRSYRFVALGACESGVIDVRLAVDEFVGLPMTIISAGARSVVASLWVVEAKATASLLQRMFELHVVDHLSPAAALRRAQLEQRDGIPVVAYDRLPIDYSKVFYWASFSCYGQ